MLEVNVQVNLQKVASELEYEPIPMSIISSIPKKHHHAFSILSRWNNLEIDEMSSALSTEKFCATESSLAKEIAKEASSIKEEDIELIISALSGLSRVVGDIKADPKQIATDVCALMKKGEVWGVESKSFSRQKFIPVIESWIKSKPLLLVAKAKWLASDYQNVFSTGHVTTDIRPIFEYDSEEAPQSAILVHTLHIHYHIADEAEAHRDIYFTLNSKELKYLKDWFIEAERQGDLLTEKMSSGGMRLISTKDNS